MDLKCERDSICQNDCALRFTVVTKPAPIMEYLKTISSVIRASHILGIFETNDFIKVYFDDKESMDTIIRKGIHILDHHIQVDYFVPPGKKIQITNIDPVVKNCELIKVMSTFGSIESPIFRSCISDDVEFCHIDYGKRYFYMNLNRNIPDILEFKYGDQLCKINVKIEENVTPYTSEEPTISSNPSPDAEPINVLNDDNQLSQPVAIDENNAADDSSDQPTESQSSIETRDSIVSMKRRGKARRSSQINKKMKQNIKFKHQMPKEMEITEFKNEIKIESPEETVNEETWPSLFVAQRPCDSSTSSTSRSEDSISKISSLILEQDKLASFLDESRYNHAPIELVKKYIGHDFKPNDLFRLIEQLHDYRKKIVEETSVKNRIYRLTKTLMRFVNDE